ncbi:hypothetical protein P9112_003039 [Eukaryota sp. TZLM1-RC]
MCRFLLLILVVLPLLAAGKTHFHLTPFTHTDPGWLDTFDKYYNQQVVRILDNVYKALKDNPDRHFCYSDISFFARWFESQTPTIQEDFRRLVNNGQFSFVQGGWVSHDEASPTAESIALQLTTGQEWIRDVLGFKSPIRVSWQIDPFGHSSSSMALAAHSGFELVIINRIHFKLKEKLRQQRQMEFLWQGTRGAGKHSRSLAHVLYKHYSAPKGFDFEDVHWQISRHNVVMKADQLLRDLRNQAKAYPSNHVMVPVGDDFKFKQAEKQFANWEMLMNSINERYDDVDIYWSTPEIYLDKVLEEKVEFPVYNGDFFPYSDNADAYWTGYYSTSPVLKKKIRSSESILRVADVTAALAGSKKRSESVDDLITRLEEPRRTVSLVQHHDAITGTSRHQTLIDYHRRLDSAIMETEKVVIDGLEVITEGSIIKNLKLSGPSTVVIVNPDKVSKTFVDFSLTIDDQFRCFDIVSSKGEHLDFKVTPAINHASFDGPDTSLDDQVAVSVLIDLLPFSVTQLDLIPCKRNGFMEEAGKLTLFSKETSMNKIGELWKGVKNFGILSGDHVIDFKDIHEFNQVSVEMGQNSHFELDKSGQVSSVTIKGKKFDISSQILEYSTKRSGAYLFRPLEEPRTLELKARYAIISENRLGSSATVWFDTGLAIKWSIGHVINDVITLDYELSVQAKENQEIVVRFASNHFQSKKIDFWTDNGLELVLRSSHSDSIAADYFPSVRYSALTSEKSSMALYHSQALGARAEDNYIEVMVARNLKDDDGRGIGQGHKDSSISKVEFSIIFDGDYLFDSSFGSIFEYRPLCFFSNKLIESEPIHLFEYLPNNLRILSISPSRSDEVVLRVMPSIQPTEEELDSSLINGDYDYTTLEGAAVEVPGLFARPTSFVERRSLTLNKLPEFSYKPNGVLKLSDSTELATQRSANLKVNSLNEKLSSFSMSKPDFLRPQEVATFVVRFGESGVKNEPKTIVSHGEKIKLKQKPKVPEMMDERLVNIKDYGSKNFPVVVTLHPSRHQLLVTSPSRHSNLQIFLAFLLSSLSCLLLLALLSHLKKSPRSVF